MILRWKRKIRKRDLHLNGDRLSRNETWCAVHDHNYYMCHICAKGFLDSNFNQAILDKISDFHKIAPNFTFSPKSFVFSVIETFYTNCFYPIRPKKNMFVCPPATDRKMRKNLGRDFCFVLFFFFKDFKYENSPFSTENV